MFEFNTVKRIQVEITNNCQASCPMCLRNIHGGIDNPLLKLNEWSFDDFKTIFNDDVLNQIEEIDFCGVFGDPILNNDLIKMCEYVKNNSNVGIVIHTNGSLRNTEWWKELYHSLPQKHTVNFAIDGLSDTHSIYRIGTSYNKIIENAQSFNNEGGNSNWIFIKFKHNEHQVLEAERLSVEYKFNSFQVKQSKRFGDKFPVLDKNGNVTHYIEQYTDSQVKPVKFVDIKDYKSWPNIIKCFTMDEKELYIDANKNILPCCLTASFLYANYDVELFNKYNLINEDSITSIAKIAQDEIYELINELGGFDNINTITHTVKDIVDSSVWQTLVKTKWKNKELSSCTILCSDSSKFLTINDQKIYQS